MKRDRERKDKLESKELFMREKQQKEGASKENALHQWLQT
jgi:hypothetical protein